MRRLYPIMTHRSCRSPNSPDRAGLLTEHAWPTEGLQIPYQKVGKTVELAVNYLARLCPPRSGWVSGHRQNQSPYLRYNSSFFYGLLTIKNI